MKNHKRNEGGTRAGNPVWEPVFLTHDEVTDLLEAVSHRPPKSVRAGGPRNHAIICTLVYAGLRVSELCALNVKDIDLPNKRLYVWHGKGNKMRTVPMNSRLVAALQDYLAVRPESRDDALFVSRHKRRIAPRTVEWIVEVWGDDAGIRRYRDGRRKKMHPHALRHTAATHWLAADVPLAVVSKWLGHTSVTTTMRYLHLYGEERWVELSLTPP